MIWCLAMTPLRPYQSRAVENVLSLWQSGVKRVCLVMPTGAGKTVTAMAASQGMRALWLVHRRELVEQSPGEAVTIQSLLSGRRPECDLLIIDECHHFTTGAEKWFEVAKHYPKILGLTATPQRHDGSPLGDLFEKLVVGAQYSELLRDGHIVPCVVMRPVEEIAGVAQSPISAWQSIAGKKRGLAFFSRVKDAEEFARGMGTRCAVVHGEQTDAERSGALAKWNAGLIDCLANVFVLTEGVDLPDAEVCMIARGCQHHGTYLQMVGRVLRPAPGKTSALLIDLPGLSHRHGLPTEDRLYSLSGEPISRKEKSLRQCKECGLIYESGQRCPHCGFIPEPVVKKAAIWNMPLVEAGKAVLTEKEKRILRFRQRWTSASRDARLAEYRRLQAIGLEKGYKPGWAKYQMKIRTGEWPRW